MKMTKKVLAVVLAVLMAFSALGVISFADDVDADAARLAKIKSDYAVLLEELTENYNWANWKYVAENNKEISNLMITYTVFYMYDDAWKNAFDKSVSIENAEAVLAALLEQYQAEFYDEYIAKAAEILSGVQTAAGYVEKINDFFGGDNFINSQEWSDAMGALGTVINIANTTAAELARLEEIYARIMTVKMANQDFVDMLTYIAANCVYDVDKQAAAALLEEIEKSDAQIAEELIATAAADLAGDAAMTAINAAMDSNAYTAVAAKVYSIAKKTANELFNASAQSVLTDTLYSTFFFETTINDYAEELLADDAAAASSVLAALNMDISMRRSGNTALINLKAAQKDGWVNKIIDKLSNRIIETYIADALKLDMIEDLFNSDEDYGVASALIEVFCPVTAAINGYTLADDEVSYLGAEGYFKSAASEYLDEFVKVIIPFDLSAAADDLVLAANDAGNVQIIIHELGADGIAEYAFASGAVDVAAGDQIVIADLAGFEGDLPVATKNGEAIEMANAYKAPEAPKPTAGDVANATGEVAKDWFSNLLSSFKGIFAQILAALKSIFSFGK